MLHIKQRQLKNGHGDGYGAGHGNGDGVELDSVDCQDRIWAAFLFKGV